MDETPDGRRYRQPPPIESRINANDASIYHYIKQQRYDHLD